MLRQNIFQRGTVINDDIFGSKKGLGQMATIFSTEDHDLVMVTLEFDITFMDENFL